MQFHVMGQKTHSGAYKRNFRHVPVKQSKTGIAQGAIPVFSDFLSRAAAPALRSARRGFGLSCTLPTTLNKNLILFNYKCRKSGGKRTSPLCRLRWPGRFAPYVFPNCASKTRPGVFSPGRVVCKCLFYLVSSEIGGESVIIAVFTGSNHNGNFVHRVDLRRCQVIGDGLPFSSGGFQIFHK